MDRGRRPAPARWWALALVGRLGRLLGFRWVFPFGTLPIPFHPLLLPGTLLALLGWLGWRVAGLVTGSSPDSAWGPALVLLAGAVVVGLGLSVPVLSWVVLVLGGRLVQAALVLAAMVLLAVSAVTGRDAAWAAVLPAVFVAAWAVQAIGGRVERARLVAAAAGFVPVDAQDRGVVLGTSVDAAAYKPLMDAAGAAAVWVRARRDGDRSTVHVRVSAELADRLRELARDVLPEGAVLREHGDAFLLACHAPLADDAIWVEVETLDRRARFVRGDLRRAAFAVAFGDTFWTRSVVVGTASVVLPVPLAQCFHWVSLTSRSEWHVGFGHGKAQRLRCDVSDLHLLFAAGRPAEPLGAAALDGVLLPLRREIEDRDAAVARLRADALAGPVDLTAHRRTLDQLRRGGTALLGDDAPEFLAAWLQLATSGAQQDLPSTVAELIEKLSDEEITAHDARFLGAFNSRKLALEWTLGPDLDPAPLPRDLYRFGTKAGFGLVFRHPALYVRLGDLLPPFRDLVAALGREMALPDVVREAQAGWSTERSP